MKNVCSPEVYRAAWNFATHKHRNQVYGGSNEGESIPYINHVASVAMEVACASANTREDIDIDLAIQCALLHDTIEDTDASFDELERLFGNSVASGVAALSKDDTLPTKEEQMRDSVARIKKEPKEVWMVKLADRISNLNQPPHNWDDERKIAYRVEAVLIMNELGASNAVLAARLSSKISEYSKYLSTK